MPVNLEATFSFIVRTGKVQARVFSPENLLKFGISLEAHNSLLLILPEL
jgi:hypothetical protein